MDYVTSHQDFAGSYLHSTVKAVKSWLLANDIELRHKIRIRGVDETPTLKDERIPSKEELRRILLSATKLPTKADLAGTEKVLLISTYTDPNLTLESIRITTYSSAQHKFALRDLSFPTEQLAEEVYRILPNYSNHYIFMLIDKIGTVQILIAEKAPRDQWPTSKIELLFDYGRIFDRLRIVDWDHDRIIAEVPTRPLAGNSVWTMRPQAFGLPNRPRLHRIIGILVSCGPSPYSLGIIAEAWDSWNRWVRLFEFQSQEECETATKLLCPLVSNWVRIDWRDATFELLLLNEDVVKAVTALSATTS